MIWLSLVLLLFILITSFVSLVKNGHSKIHVYGLFTAKFPLNHGASEGCPLLPLLLANSTQPLVALLQKAQLGRNSRDIHWPFHHLFQKLFVDEGDIFSKPLKQAL